MFRRSWPISLSIEALRLINSISRRTRREAPFHRTTSSIHIIMNTGDLDAYRDQRPPSSDTSQEDIDQRLMEEVQSQEQDLVPPEILVGCHGVTPSPSAFL